MAAGLSSSRKWFANVYDYSSHRYLHTSSTKVLRQLNATNAANLDGSRKDVIDFGKAVEDFKRNGMAILPLKIDLSYVSRSKDMVLSAWSDAMHRAKIIRGHELKVGKDYGFKEIVQRAKGRYDMHWKVNGEEHFLDKENILAKFMPFVEAILGKSFVPQVYI